MLRRTILGLLLSAALFAAGEKVTAVDSVGVTVSNLDRALAFYTGVLTFEKISASSEADQRTARLKLGDEYLELIQYTRQKGRPMPADTRSNDLWFQHVALIVSDMDAAYARLRANGVRNVSLEPQTLPSWNKNAGGIKAFYFQDPDGHRLEILQFPAGKGDPKWQRKDALFLGIDHTAIAVSDTEQSLRFYRDELGLNIAGESENYGPEQERLNNVAGARLRITALRAPSGPGIELLEYLAPRGGRPFPDAPQPHDLFHWETRLVLGHRPAALFRDPDGHALRAVR
ncbi:MAG: VOC family protein [Bryobacteraceae bacterium]|nr:VOC family protein [Bryobacteraceae bacterium]